MKEYVIMADIIESSSYSGEKLMTSFAELVDKTNIVFQQEIKSPLTITIGDEFQGIVTSVSSALHIMIYMEEFLIENQGVFRLRYVLNQGEIATEVNTLRAYKMLGEGLTDARRQLIANKKSGTRFHFTLDDPYQTEILNQTMYLYQHLIDNWTDKDLEVAGHFISGRSYKEVARITGRDDSTTWRREKSLGMKAYNICKELLFNLAK